ncbi:MAG: DNA/RNA non-specific endonuclease [Kiloniellales bacterium]|nr:DNA/RNA non-specific endonuclease [Kiloniellales bacterium]
MQRVVWLGLLLSIVVFSSSHAAEKERYCSWKGASETTVAEADAALQLKSAERDAAIAEHLPWGIPTNPPRAENEELLVSRHYVANHDADLFTSTWTAHRLTAADLVSRTRHDAFRSDPRLDPEERGHCADYKEPIFDQGHLVPNSDMGRSENAMLNTYVMSNMAPQYCNFNRGTWVFLEHAVRKWAEAKGDIIVFTGAIFDRDGKTGRDNDGYAIRMYSNPDKRRRVAIATHFYKIVLHERPNGFVETITVVLPHRPAKVPKENRPAYLAANIASIDFVEERTGIKFLPAMAAAQEDAVTAATASALWPVSSWGGDLAGRCKAFLPEF